MYRNKQSKLESDNMSKDEYRYLSLKESDAGVSEKIMSSIPKMGSLFTTFIQQKYDQLGRRYVQLVMRQNNSFFKNNRDIRSNMISRMAEYFQRKASFLPALWQRTFELNWFNPKRRHRQLSTLTKVVSPDIDNDQDPESIYNRDPILLDNKWDNIYNGHVPTTEQLSDNSGIETTYPDKKRISISRLRYGNSRSSIGIKPLFRLLKNTNILKTEPQKKGYSRQSTASYQDSSSIENDKLPTTVTLPGPSQSEIYQSIRYVDDHYRETLPVRSINENAITRDASSRYQNERKRIKQYTDKKGIQRSFSYIMKNPETAGTYSDSSEQRPGKANTGNLENDSEFIENHEHLPLLSQIVQNSGLNKEINRFSPVKHIGTDSKARTDITNRLQEHSLSKHNQVKIIEPVISRSESIVDNFSNKLGNLLGKHKKQNASTVAPTLNQVWTKKKSTAINLVPETVKSIYRPNKTDPENGTDNDFIGSYIVPEQNSVVEQYTYQAGISGPVSDRDSITGRYRKLSSIQSNLSLLKNPEASEHGNQYDNQDTYPYPVTEYIPGNPYRTPMHITRKDVVSHNDEKSVKELPDSRDVVVAPSYRSFSEHSFTDIATQPSKKVSPGIYRETFSEPPIWETNGSGTALDINSIADDVYSILKRRLSRERERKLGIF